MATLDEAKQFLKREKGGNKSLYDHLSDVMLKVLVDKPSDAYDSFEHISASIKKLNIAPKAIPDYADDVDDAETTRITKTKQLAWVKACNTLLKRPDEPPPEGAAYPNLLDDAHLYEWAGVTMGGPEETFRLFLAIKAFAETLPGENGPLRFFGRIETRTQPYYVLEGQTAEDPEADPEVQEGKDGANKHTYWITRYPGDVWVKLPAITSKHVVVSRKISRLFTGNLEEKVPGYPPFPGQEKHLLAATLVRISSSTAISPAGHWVQDEDSEDPLLKPADDEALNETFPKPAEELKALDAWVHHELEVNAIGRVRPLPEQTDENGDPIEREQPEPVDTLRPLSDDAEGSWSIRVAPGGAAENNSSCVVARSLVWPGAHAIASGRRYTYVYSGNGLKYRAAPYIVDAPPAIQKEWAPNEEEEEEPLVEQADVLVDPTLPEEPEDEEDA